MKRTKLFRWLGLFLAVESCLWLFGACRPCFDYQGSVNRSKPLLLSSKNPGILLIHKGNQRVYFYDPNAINKLEEIMRRKKSTVDAQRTRAGQLLDNHGRILLDNISESSVYAYSAEYDLLVWGTSPGTHPYGLNIRHGGQQRFVRTGSIDDLQIRPDGTIWLAEYQLQCGISVLSSDGHFLGWRAFGYQNRFIQQFCEVDDADMPLVNRLLAHSKK